MARTYLFRLLPVTVTVVLTLTLFHLSPLTLSRVSLGNIESSEKSSFAMASSSSVAGPVDANIFVNLSKKLIPSVVNISTFTTMKGPLIQGGPSEDVLKKFFGDLFRQYHRNGRGNGSGSDLGEEDDDGLIPGLPSQKPFPRHQTIPPKMPKAMSLGTGFIVDASGLILTNNHVVADADEIKITFTESTDEKPTDAEVVGRDPEIDVALIKVKGKRDMIPVTLGDSDKLEVGEYVMAVGNPFGQGHSVTHGIISAKGRPAPDFPLANYLQTDAPINPGNSGGPLVNLKGEVIGINNAIDQRGQGMGFAIPISLYQRVEPQLKTKGIVARGFIGVLVDALSPELAKHTQIPEGVQGPVVSHVYPNEAADKAGVKPYDVILEFNQKTVKSPADLIAAVTSVNVGDSVPLKVLRGKQEKLLTIRVSQRPGAQTVTARKAEQDKKKSKKKLPPVETGMTLEPISSEMAVELGLNLKAMTGLMVSDIAYGGAADRAGMMRGDVIVEVDQKSVKTLDQFFAVVKETKSYLLRVRRMDPQGTEIFQLIVLDLKA